MPARMKQKSGKGNSMDPWSAGISSGIGALGNIYAANAASNDAYTAREASRKQANKQTDLSVKKFNMNQDRMAGIAGSLGGGKTGSLKGKGDFEKLNANDYKLGEEKRIDMFGNSYTQSLH